MAIKRIKLQCFRRFTSLDVNLDSSLNMFVGDNESGKSTLLLALDLALAGSRSKVESISLESLFNSSAIEEFMSSERRIPELPVLFVELYFNEQNNPDLNGKNNSCRTICDGVQLSCHPMDLLSNEIESILKEKDACFPFEYYEIQFHTFSGKPYAGYNRPVRHISIDSSTINNEYATREYVKDLYFTNVEGTEKNKHQNEYRRHKERFRTDVLSELNARMEKYGFTIRTTGKSNLEADLTIADKGIPIENKGKGQQCFIKTEFALNKPKRQDSLQVILLEEPENHLSHVNMRRLIGQIRESTGRQLFVATHSSLITSRLDLRKCIILNNATNDPASLDSVPDDTAEFFMKAPDNNVLEFILSKRVILVEGNAEYILTECFFSKVTGEAPEHYDTHIIAVGGTSFKRYLDLAMVLNIKTAVIRDNDGNYQANCVERYEQYNSDHIAVFADQDDERHTFEIWLYADNKDICEDAFGSDRRSLSVKEYMLANKAEAAFALLRDKADNLNVPQYIRNAIEWIKQ